MTDQTNSPQAAPGDAFVDPGAGTAASTPSAAGGGVTTSVTPDEIFPTRLPGTVELPPEDRVRRGLAFFVLWIVAGVIAAGLILTACVPWLGLEPERVQSTIQFFFTATITLAGSVFGFYFASKNR
jgi:hypothetical protein